MTKGSCNPAPAPYNVDVMSKDNGRVTLTIRWGWDGVSVWPDCKGPIQDVRVQNTGPNVWLVSAPNSTSAKTFEVPPGTDRTFTGQQLNAIGLVTVADVFGITLVPAP